MRLVGTVENEQLALMFSQFLRQKGIAHQIEVKKNSDWGSPFYGASQCQIWIYDEEDFEKVSEWFHKFTENRQDPLFSASTVSPMPFEQPIPSPPPPASPPPSGTSRWEGRPMGVITRAILLICCLLFIASKLLMPTIDLPERYSGLVLFVSPIEKVLLYDYPKYYQLIEQFLRHYGFEELEHPTSDLSLEGQHLLKQINQTPFWPGLYDIILTKGLQGAKKAFVDYPTFEKIKEGEIWRTFTPCLLHADIFHIFFNMLWLIVLGKQMEQRLKPFRYLVFIVLVGIFSNTLQYLTSGANFIGYSGILCGMIAFIWMRQRHAAWEGYQIDRLTFLFILLFVITMAGIQILSFVLEKSLQLTFAPNIANMAHLSGGLIGFVFGKLNYFSWRHT